MKDKSEFLKSTTILTSLLICCHIDFSQDPVLWRGSLARASIALASRFSRARGTRAQVVAPIILFRGKERERTGPEVPKSTKITLKKKTVCMA